MRRLRIACVIVFIASLALLGVSLIKGRARDTVGPTIEVSAGLIEVSVKDDEKALCEGIKATDAVDGDVTDKLYVESIGPFDEAMHRTVTYIAFDTHNNITRAQRELVYTDYTAPRFRIEKPFVFDTETTANVLLWTTTEDVLDGVKSGNVFIRTDEEVDIGLPGEYKVVLETTNSAGDTASLPVTIEIYEKEERAGKPQIELGENIVYLEKGAKWDARQYLKSVSLGGAQYTPTNLAGTYGTAQDADSAQEKTINYSSVKIQDSVNTAQPGSYEVVYTFEDTAYDTGTGTARLYVVVTERGK